MYCKELIYVIVETEQTSWKSAGQAMGRIEAAVHEGIFFFFREASGLLLKALQLIKFGPLRLS